MRYEFNKVIDGIARYIDKEIYSGMNDLQEIIARIAVGMLIGNEDNVKANLVNNGFIRTFGIVDADGTVDVYLIAKQLKKEIAKKEKLVITFPMFGKMTFSAGDVDVLYREITGEDMTEDEE